MKILKSSVFLKNYLYNKNILNKSKVTIPIISVGNLTMGGTGKTAIISYLISYYEKKGLNVGVVSRGYKGTYDNLIEVDLVKSQSLFGDEPFMLKTQFPKTKIILCADRRKAYSYLLDKYKVDIVLADDSFQHRKLGRTLDVVVFDALEQVDNYFMFPRGRLREPISSLIRADVIILNKINLANNDQKLEVLNFFENKILFKFKPKYGFFVGKYSIKKITNTKNKIELPLNNLGNVLLVSGIGQPEGFENIVFNLNKKKLNHLVFSDHFSYTKESIKLIKNKLEEHGLNKILVTEKDHVKLLKFKEIQDYLFVTHLQFDVEGVLQNLNKEFKGKGPFDEVFNGLIR